MLDIAMLDDYLRLSPGYGDWASLGPEARLTVFADHVFDEDALIERLRWFDCVCIMRERTRLTRRVLEGLPRLKLIVTAANQNPAVDMEAANRLGILVCGTPMTANRGNSSAEITIALMLAVARWIPQERDSLRGNGWQSRLGVPLSGRTLGIVGFGRLARIVARIAQALNMTVITASKSLSEAEAAAHGVRKVGWDELFRAADFVNIQLLLAPETTGIVGAREIGLMRRDAFLINAARGPIVDEAALIAALRDGRIAGAGLDVFDLEPLPPDHPFRHLPNVVATPHIGFATKEAYQTFYSGMVKTIAAYMKGEPIETHNAPARAR